MSNPAVLSDFVERVRICGRIFSKNSQSVRDG
nr:MAG TPA: hypothetical protein [Caudoviricetes sp.]